MPEKPEVPENPEAPENPEVPAPVAPCIPPYGNKFHVVEPLPILNKLVFVSIPISPEARIGLAVAHSVEVPRLN
jgi:hypothetical protein